MSRSLLVIGEVSLALLLLIGAALFIRALMALRSVNPGFNPRNVVTTRTALDPKFAKASGVNQLVQDIFRRLNALPGVETAAFTRMLPLEGTSNSIPMIVVGRPLNGPSHGSSRWMVVSSGYFEALKIPSTTIHSLTQETWDKQILHTSKDKISAIRLDDYYQSYRLISAFLAVLDQWPFDNQAPSH